MSAETSSSLLDGELLSALTYAFSVAPEPRSGRVHEGEMDFRQVLQFIMSDHLRLAAGEKGNTAFLLYARAVSRSGHIGKTRYAWEKWKSTAGGKDRKVKHKTCFTAQADVSVNKKKATEMPHERAADGESSFLVQESPLRVSIKGTRVGKHKGVKGQVEAASAWAQIHFNVGGNELEYLAENIKLENVITCAESQTKSVLLWAGQFMSWNSLKLQEAGRSCRLPR